jgi:hypothetical protein
MRVAFASVSRGVRTLALSTDDNAMHTPARVHFASTLAAAKKDREAEMRMLFAPVVTKKVQNSPFRDTNDSSCAYSCVHPRGSSL